MSQKLIEIKEAEKVIFIGDTHGDLEASQKVIKNFLKQGVKIVFLGDYVDRGKFSKENVDFLLEQREKYPNNIFLLQGNHEGHRILPFSPAEFWESLKKEDYEKYSSLLEKLPLALVVKNIIALHGALPQIEIENFNQIEVGDENWYRICWGDFYDLPGKELGLDALTGRPRFGREYFFTLMKKFKKDVLIRSHQPDAPLFMFEEKCITIFTSSAYLRKRTIAILDFKKNVKTAKDLIIKELK